MADTTPPSRQTVQDGTSGMDTGNGRISYQSSSATPQKPAQRVRGPLERRRDWLRGQIRKMPEGPAKQAARLRLIGVAYEAWMERTGRMT